MSVLESIKEVRWTTMILHKIDWNQIEEIVWGPFWSFWINYTQRHNKMRITMDCGIPNP